MTDEYTNAKTVKLGVYLHTVNEVLSYFTCKCGHRSAQGPTDLIRQAAKRHICKEPNTPPPA